MAVAIWAEKNAMGFQWGMSMKFGFAALSGALIVSSAAHAAITVTALPDNFQVSSTDAFDVSQGTVITGTSGSNPVSPPENAIGGNSGGSEPTSYIFADGSQQLQTLSFKTATPVSISGFNLYLGQDGPGNGDIRGFDTVALYGSLDGTNYTNLGSINLVNPYQAGYGAPGILVTSTFAASTYQFFRFEGTPYDQGAFSETYSGGRIFEIDAISSVSAAPEPASWMMIIGGFGMLGAALRSRKAGVSYA